MRREALFGWGAIYGFIRNCVCFVRYIRIIRVVVVSFDDSL